MHRNIALFQGFKVYYDEISKQAERDRLTLRKRNRDELIMQKRLLKEESKSINKNKTQLKYEITEDSIKGLSTSVMNLQFKTETILVKEMKRLLESEDILENKYAILVIRKYSLVDSNSLVFLFKEHISELLLHNILKHINDVSTIVSLLVYKYIF